MQRKIAGGPFRRQGNGCWREDFGFPYRRGRDRSDRLFDILLERGDVHVVLAIDDERIMLDGALSTLRRSMPKARTVGFAKKQAAIIMSIF